MKDNHFDFNNKGMLTYALLSGGVNLWVSNLRLEFGEISLGGYESMDNHPLLPAWSVCAAQPNSISGQHGAGGCPQSPARWTTSASQSIGCVLDLGGGGKVRSKWPFIVLRWFLKKQKELRCICNRELFLNSLLLLCFAVCRHRNPPLQQLSRVLKII